MTHNGRQIKIYAFPDEIKHLTGISFIQGDSYIIGINKKLPQDQYKHILGHELAHILLNHLDSLKPGERTTADQELKAEQKASEYYTLFADQISFIVM